jgi:RecA/RadA recombinase
MAKAYMDKYPESVLLFYDSEFGTPQAYFDSFKIDASRVLHTPITDIEQLKFDIMSQLDQINRGDRVIIVIDSVGNLASKKEVEDALKQNSAADMTRAKQLKSLFRMVTPHLNLKDIPMVVVNHTYMTQEMFSKPVVSGGTGIYYSADNIYIIGRQQEKEGTEVVGYNFIINVEKSRFVKANGLVCLILL